MHGQFDLLKTRRFFPLFMTQFWGAFNDNVFKNALVILITYMTAEDLGLDPGVLVTIAAGVFILPFFLFSAIAGQLADYHDKSMLIRRLKGVECLLMVLAAVGFFIQDIYFLLGVLFLMGTQSSFFGPLKYGILPDHLKSRELIGANALVEAGTFIAILCGTIIGGIFILKPDGVWIISGVVLGIAGIGLLFSIFIPKAPPAQSRQKPDWNIIRASYHILSYARQNRDIFTAILGISWFWVVGFVYLAQLPVYGKVILNVDEHVVTMFLTCFSVGIGLGSLLCNRFLKGEIGMHFAPFGALGLAGFTAALYGISPVDFSQGEGLMTLSTFIMDPTHILILLVMVCVAISAGFYVVPLYAVLQNLADPAYRARIIAANNIMNAVFMVVASVAIIILLKYVQSVVDLFLILSVMNLAVAILFYRKVHNA